MASYSRELTVLGLLGATLWLPHCSQLTKVDWSLIPPGGGTSSGGVSEGGGTPAGAAGETSEAGEGGLSGAAGEAGAGGEGDVVDTGGGGASAGLGGGSGGTLGGNGGSGGSIAGGGTGGAMLLHPTCKLPPAPPTSPPDLSNAIVFFDGGVGGNGNRGGRGSSVVPYSGLDGACASAKDALGLPHTDTHAVISLSLDDEIFKMPQNFGIPRLAPHVVSPLGVELASSWNNVWVSAGIPVSLVCGGVMPLGVDTWLTGSGNKGEQNPSDPDSKLFGIYDFTIDLSGVEYSHACNQWAFSAADPDVTASVGSTISQNDGGLDGHPYFLGYALYSCSEANSHLLCVAYDKVP